jgi:hypothetical protein
VTGRRSETGRSKVNGRRNVSEVGSVYQHDRTMCVYKDLGSVKGGGGTVAGRRSVTGSK